MDVREIKKQFDAWREEYRQGDAVGYNVRLNGVVIGELTRACGSEEKRHLVQGFLFYRQSVSGVGEDVRYALQKFVAPKYDNKMWKVRDGLFEECRAIVKHVEARKAYEQSILNELGV